MQSEQTDATTYCTKCEEDEDGNLILTFPDELLDSLGWGEGTYLDFDIVGSRIIIREVLQADF